MYVTYAAYGHGTFAVETAEFAMDADAAAKAFFADLMVNPTTISAELYDDDDRLIETFDRY